MIAGGCGLNYGQGQGQEQEQEQGQGQGQGQKQNHKAKIKVKGSGRGRPLYTEGTATFCGSVAVWIYLRCCLLLICGNEYLRDKSLERRRSCVAGGARFESAHVSGVKRCGHLEHQTSELLRHSHLNQGGTKLIVGRPNIGEFGFADGFSDDGCDFVVIDVALSVEFLGLFAAEFELQESIGGKRADIARGDHGKFEVGTNRSDG